MRTGSESIFRAIPHIILVKGQSFLYGTPLICIFIIDAIQPPYTIFAPTENHLQDIRKKPFRLLLYSACCGIII